MTPFFSVKSPCFWVESPFVSLHLLSFSMIDCFFATVKTLYSPPLPRRNFHCPRCVCATFPRWRRPTAERFDDENVEPFAPFEWRLSHRRSPPGRSTHYKFREERKVQARS